MGHKIFVSYKYKDNDVKRIGHNNSTVRDYVDKIEDMLTNVDHIYKGEHDDEDLSEKSDDAIWDKLKDRIFDSTLTIILISKGMKENKKDRDQWIPWEISYSLREVNRKNKSGNYVKSAPNALLAIVIPDRDGRYEYYLDYKNCCNSGCRLITTNYGFKIMKANYFNIKKPDKYTCDTGTTIYNGDSSYISTVRWDEFINNMEKHIDNAYNIQSKIKNYDVFIDLDAVEKN